MKRIGLLWMISYSLIAQVEFSDPVLIGEMEIPNSKLKTADLDGDGDEDIVNYKEEQLGWFENLDGKSIFSSQNIISSSLKDIWSVDIGDIDGDKKQDLFVYYDWDQPFGDDCAYGYHWYEYDTNGEISLRANLMQGGVEKTVIKDLDGDGNNDLLTGAYFIDLGCFLNLWGGVRLRFNPDGNDNLQPRNDLDNRNVYDIYAEDLDSDGDLDILSLDWDGLVWYENIDGMGHFATKDKLDIEIEAFSNYKFIDYDYDHDIDVILERDNQIVWYENDGNPRFFNIKHILNIVSPESIGTLDLYDLDIDGDMDLVFKTNDNYKMIWHENLDGLNNFGAGQIMKDLDFGEILLDIDHDGDLDILYSSGNSVYLMRNELIVPPDLHYVNFRPVENPLIEDLKSSMGIAICDYTQDSYPALFIANDNAEANQLIQTQSGWSFTNITQDPLTTELKSSTGATWGDYDNDGHPDLYVSHMGAPGSLFHNEGDGSFQAVPLMTDNLSSYGAAWADYDLDGYLDLYVSVSGDKNRLYRNNGDGTFTRITDGDIVNDINTSKITVWCDYDLDGDPDLFVANDNDENNSLYQNNGDGTFIKVTTGDLVNDGVNSWSASWGDYNQDGYPDLFVANNGQANFLYQNNGNCTFTKITNGPIVTDTDHSRSSSWADIDKDGDLDLFVSNRSEDSKLYMNKGLGNFDRYILGNGNWRGAAFGDMDLDGDMDLFVCEDGGPNHLFENNAGMNNQWLEVKCTGMESNYCGIGAKVWMKANVGGHNKWQMREISSQTGFGGQNEMIAHFGLRGTGIVDSLRIEWPSGIVWDTTQVAANQRLVITEKTTSPVINIPPIAVDDTVSTLQETSVKISVLSNDSDPDGDMLTIIGTGDAGSSGSVVIDSGDTTLTFTPAAGFSGEAEFEYMISDENGGLDTATVFITVQAITSVENLNLTPQSYALYQNHPNPFNPTTQIQYDLPKASEVRLTVYDMLGKEVMRLMQEKQSAGSHQIIWNGCDGSGHQVTSGIYFYKLQAGEYQSVRKMLLVR